MDNAAVSSFFDSLAPAWDANSEDDPALIRKILRNSGLRRKDSVLDIGCGTGILVPFLAEYSPSRIVGVDLSAKMVEEARKKFPAYEFRQADGSSLDFRDAFSQVILFNMWPHVSDPEKMIRSCHAYLREGGAMTIAFDSGRSRIDQHHQNIMHVSRPLETMDALREKMSPLFDIVFAADEEDLFQITGKKRGKRRKSGLPQMAQ